MKAEDCIEHGADCKGAVELRYPGYGERKFVRCVFHGEQRRARQAKIDDRYPAQQPADFDPADAGETWGDEDL